MCVQKLSKLVLFFQSEQAPRDAGSSEHVPTRKCWLAHARYPHSSFSVSRDPR